MNGKWENDSNILVRDMKMCFFFFIVDDETFRIQIELF